MTKNIVTGGAGFIGSTLTEKLISAGHEVLVLDALTYAGRLVNLPPQDTPGFSFVQGSIGDSTLLEEILTHYHPDTVINVAAETHVDRSIDAPASFVDTNIVGAQKLLDACLNYWRGLGGEQGSNFRFLHVSTDEVYGSVDEGAVTEDAPYRPNSPYAACKAAADHLVRAYFKTYGLPTLISHGCNTYGQRQFPEKVIPLFILRALSGMSLPVYGSGENVREWISVDDHASGLISVLDKGTTGHAYNLGSGQETSNLEMAKSICRVLEKIIGSQSGEELTHQIEFVVDRPGHDFRYSLDSTKAKAELNWQATTQLELGLTNTIQWYVNNREWWTPIANVNYDLGRLGSGSS